MQGKLEPKKKKESQYNEKLYSSFQFLAVQLLKQETIYQFLGGRVSIILCSENLYVSMTIIISVDKFLERWNYFLNFITIYHIPLFPK